MATGKVAHVFFSIVPSRPLHSGHSLGFLTRGLQEYPHLPHIIGFRFRMCDFFISARFDVAVSMRGEYYYEYGVSR